MIGTAVGGLRDLAAIAPELRALGERHVGYEVEPPMYGAVGAALIEALEQGLGRAWNAEVEEAWAQVYQLLAGTMLAGAERSR